MLFGPYLPCRRTVLRERRHRIGIRLSKQQYLQPASPPAVRIPGLFRLRTGRAGAVLSKFQIYNIKAALIPQDKPLLEERFGEMVLESNKGNDFRLYDNAKAAEEWIFQTSISRSYN